MVIQLALDLVKGVLATRDAHRQLILQHQFAADEGATGGGPPSPPPPLWGPIERGLLHFRGHPFVHEVLGEVGMKKLLSQFDTLGEGERRGT